MAEEIAERKEIPGFDGYSVDRNGRVFNKDGRELKIQLRRGIPAVTIRRGGRATSSSVQRLVCLAWLGEPKPNQIALRTGSSRRSVKLEDVRWGQWEERQFYDED